MAIMLDNGKFLSEKVDSLLSAYKATAPVSPAHREHLFTVVYMDSEMGRYATAPLTAWDGESIVLADRTELYELGLALGVVPAPKKTQSCQLKEGFLVLSHSEFSKIFGSDCKSFLAISGMSTDGENGMKKRDDFLSELGLRIVYDSAKDRRFTESRYSVSPINVGWTYKGDLPADTQLLLMESIAVKDASRFYQSSLFVHAESGNNQITRIDRAKTLMEALTLEKNSVPYPDPVSDSMEMKHRRDTIESYMVDADYAFDSTLSDIVEGYRFYSNLSVLWEEITKDELIRLRVDGNVLRNAEKLKNGFKKLACAIGADSYIDAYCSGVPIEDILA